MQTLTHFPIPGRHGRPVLLDLKFERTGEPKPLAVFLHGYKGFKDWGVFARMDAEFARAGYALLKLNFSHNGGTAEQPIDFPDLEAFGQNTYSKELDDVQAVLDWVGQSGQTDAYQSEIDTGRITLIGHSRGGGIATLTAASDRRIKRLVTWAAVSTLDRPLFQPGPELEAWKANGVTYVRNGRTLQDMPHFIQFYEDFQANRARFNVEAAARSLAIPHTIVHGDADAAVPHAHAEALHRWSAQSELHTVPGADHVFGGRHPWDEPELPEHFRHVLEVTLRPGGFGR